MTIASVAAGQNIDPDWHNSVATALNAYTPTFAGTTYTPTLTGMAIGTGGSASNTALYRWVGGPNTGDLGILFLRGRIVFGTTGQTFPTSATIAVPSGLNLVTGGAANLTPSGWAVYDDSGTPYFGAVSYNSTTTLWLSCFNASATFLTNTNVSTSAPFTWGNGDAINWTYVSGAVRV